MTGAPALALAWHPPVAVGEKEICKKTDNP